MKKTCSVAECFKINHAKNVCNTHYWRLKRHGTTSTPPKFIKKICSIKDCQNFTSSRGWCEKHYCRWRAYGDPNIVKFEWHEHGLSKTREYRIWGSMKTRCLNSKAKSYSRYGGRGITICDRWVKSFPDFLEDMGDAPDNTYSIDRIDNDGNYEPGNVRWATRTEQNINKDLYPNNTSGFRGVSLANKKWVANIQVNKKPYRLGVYVNPVDAAIAYNKAAIRLHGKNARLNILPK